MRRTFAFIAAPLLFVAAGLDAQAPGPALGLQGTAAYNRIWNTTAVASDGFCSTGFRFSGRVALRLPAGFYAGLSVGSWEYSVPIGDVSGNVFPDTYDRLATSVVMSSYAQAYPSRRTGIFVRGGVGVAINRTYAASSYPVPPGTVVFSPPDMVGVRSVHPSLTGGAGFDLPIPGRLAITLSADYTRLIGTFTGREATSALQIGLGLTIR